MDEIVDEETKKRFDSLLFDEHGNLRKEVILKFPNG